MQSPTTKEAPGAEVQCGGAIKRPSDFSIEHILKKAGRSCAIREEGNPVPGEEERAKQHPEVSTRFEWLQCTRYHPPKLPRSPRAPEGRRKLGRNPRIPFSSGQVSALESRFRRGHYLSSADVHALANALQLSEARVKIWFQNRRARERRDREAAKGPAEGASPPGALEKQGKVPDIATSHPPELAGSQVPSGAQDSSLGPSNLFSGAPLLLQGLNSAFVPFPRARQALKDGSPDGSHVSMTSPGGSNLISSGVGHMTSPGGGHIRMTSPGRNHISITPQDGSRIPMYSGHSPPPATLAMVASIQGQTPAPV
ncbi:homeobox protein MSX-1 [Ischnura elegans]|uniref:homeobox protein MSX-1 n=1 Tax=Ischnura elegans TaxID=197161 RepID=UPI001ED883F8|nr:homeobox protein MSX-1 [Ischnura elegans]